jgi:hypothetical protein
MYYYYYYYYYYMVDTIRRIPTTIQFRNFLITYMQWRTEGGLGGSTPPPLKLRKFDKAEPNSHFRGKYICNNLIRIRISLICKLSGTPD